MMTEQQYEMNAAAIANSYRDGITVKEWHEAALAKVS